MTEAEPPGEEGGGERREGRRGKEKSGGRGGKVREGRGRWKDDRELEVREGREMGGEGDKGTTFTASYYSLETTLADHR